MLILELFLLLRLVRVCVISDRLGFSSSSPYMDINLCVRSITQVIDHETHDIQAS